MVKTLVAAMTVVLLLNCHIKVCTVEEDGEDGGVSFVDRGVLE